MKTPLQKNYQDNSVLFHESAIKSLGAKKYRQSTGRFHSIDGFIQIWVYSNLSKKTSFPIEVKPRGGHSKSLQTLIDV